jgi:hypothetical protein
VAVEIQALVLCRDLKYDGVSVPELFGACLCSIHPADGRYPFDVSPRFFLQLRKDSREALLPFEITLRVVDEDGKVLETPGVHILRGMFPKDHRFWMQSGGIRVVLPRPGVHSLRCEVRGGGEPSHSRYDFEAD